MLTRRHLIKTSSLALGAGLVPRAATAEPVAENGLASPLYLNLNESAFGPSPLAVEAARQALTRVNRYADAQLARVLTEKAAARERVPAEQIVLGEVLDVLGTYYAAGTQTAGNSAASSREGGEFLYSSPGYLALIDAASRLGGVGVPVPLDHRHQNDLPALAARVNSRTRAIYLINPHNPTGTVNDDAAFKSFLRDVSRRAPIIVDEAYLEYLPDAATRSAVALVREGANVIVFRTFDKIHGLAGLPMGYAVVPRGLGDLLRKQGAENLEALGRLNLAAAAAALGDADHVREVRATVQSEREGWNRVLDELRLEHTDARASFIFFNAQRPQAAVADALRQRGVVVGRLFSPYATWVRISIGLPEENRFTQAQLREVLKAG